MIYWISQQQVTQLVSDKSKFRRETYVFLLYLLSLGVSGFLILLQLDPSVEFYLKECMIFVSFRNSRSPLCFSTEILLKLGNSKLCSVMSTPVLVILCGQLKRNTSALPTSSAGDRPIFSHGNEGPKEDLVPQIKWPL